MPKYSAYAWRLQYIAQTPNLNTLKSAFPSSFSIMLEGGSPAIKQIVVVMIKNQRTWSEIKRQKLAFWVLPKHFPSQQIVHQLAFQLPTQPCFASRLPQFQRLPVKWDSPFRRFPMQFVGVPFSSSLGSMVWIPPLPHSQLTCSPTVLEGCLIVVLDVAWQLPSHIPSILVERRGSAQPYISPIGYIQTASTQGLHFEQPTSSRPVASHDCATANLTTLYVLCP